MRQSIFRLGLIALLSGVAISACSGPGAASHDHSHDGAPAPIAPTTRYRVEVYPDDAVMGPETALVTVVLYSDYACPPCARTWKVLENLVEDHGDDLRIVVRTLTAPGFQIGEQAAEAALAAAGQGAFWAMHRRLFEGGLDRPTLEAHAKALSLDLDRFRDDLDTGAYSGQRLRHRRQALELGVAFGPVAFVNGRPVVGFHDEASWHALVNEEIAEARRRLDAGTPREGLYLAILGDAPIRPIELEGEAKAARDALIAKLPQDLDPSLPEPTEGARFQVPLGGATYFGPADAPVVIVAFMDALCPYCRRSMTTTLPELQRRYGDDLRLEIRHLPLPIHPAADGAARAAVAAGRQGRFADFYAGLFAGEKKKVNRELFLEIARGLGLDEARFLADLDDPGVAAEVIADRTIGFDAGVLATPSFFLNGRFYSGHREADFMATVIDEELAAARKAIESGTPRADAAARAIARGDPLPTIQNTVSEGTPGQHEAPPTPAEGSPSAGPTH
ncbi:MAG: thioredoxin domain-containing protein [Nannocystaceae bacterium]